MRKWIKIVMVAFFVNGCAHQQHPKVTERSIYFWKSVFKVSDDEKKIFHRLGITSIYLKYFDVAWNEHLKQPVPVAQVNIIDTGFLHEVKIVPVVFITNECLLKIQPAASDSLAENIHRLIGKISGLYNVHAREVQIDCDWTTNTKEQYFLLLQKIKELNADKILSVTIRLHQVKYISKSGVPPADRGMLMCYNMGNLKDPDAGNSIIDVQESKKYLANLTGYPLPLDVVFPLFNWKVLFRNNNYAGLIQQLPDSLLYPPVAKKIDNRYIIQADTSLAGYTFIKNDVLRTEESNYPVVMDVAALVNKKIAGDSLRVALYHLDSITLSKYSIHEIEDFYNSIH